MDFKIHESKNHHIADDSFIPCYVHVLVLGAAVLRPTSLSVGCGHKYGLEAQNHCF